MHEVPATDAKRTRQCVMSQAYAIVTVTACCSIASLTSSLQDYPEQGKVMKDHAAAERNVMRQQSLHRLLHARSLHAPDQGAEHLLEMPSSNTSTSDNEPLAVANLDHLSEQDDDIVRDLAPAKPRLDIDFLGEPIDSATTSVSGQAVQATSMGLSPGLQSGSSRLASMHRDSIWTMQQSLQRAHGGSMAAAGSDGGAEAQVDRLLEQVHDALRKLDA